MRSNRPRRAPARHAGAVLLWLALGRATAYASAAAEALTPLRQAAWPQSGAGSAAAAIAALKGGACLVAPAAPAFYQAWWFGPLCLLSAGLLLWLAHRLRLRLVAVRQRARLDERERIARELHDTLLQSTQGLIMQFQAIANRLPAHEPARGRMTAALDLADHVLAEGRDRVQQLRAGRGGADLAATLQLACATLGRQHAARWRVVVEGGARALAAPADAEVEHIAREALTNAFRHANADLIELRLRYAADALTVTVCDDGDGLPAAVARVGQRGGHWGLPGMRERAARLGAALRVDSGPGGTTVTLRLPAARAFHAGAGPRRWRDRLGRASTAG